VTENHKAGEEEQELGEVKLLDSSNVDVEDRRRLEV
jgi:hypothetical protein